MHLSKKIQQATDLCHDLAAALYQARFRPIAYQRATGHRSNRYANALIDDAMAICGSPYYKISQRKWPRAAVEFLELFA